MRRPLIVDLAIEGAAAVLGRRMRSALTTLGIALGVLTLTAMIGITSSSAASIRQEFTRLQPTRVEVSGTSTIAEFTASVGADGQQRASRLSGVRAVGTGFTSGDDGVNLQRSAEGPAADKIPLVATVGNLLAADGDRATHGRLYDAGNERRADRVVIVGALIADRLGLGPEQVPSQVLINGARFTVVAIADSDDDSSVVPLSLTMPLSTAQAVGFDTLLKSPTTVIRTRRGAAEQVATKAPLALSPLDPALLSASVPPQAVRLRKAVERQTRIQLIALSAVSIVVGAIGVSNTTLIGVMERRKEIGVRRAVGASGAAVVVQFLMESATLGLLGGAAGALVGFGATIAVAVANGWPVSMPAWLLALGPLLGLGVGVVAGGYPAYRAARIEPVEALT